jgi:hypothetical protein
MKKTFLNLSLICLIIGLLLIQTACFQERWVTGIPRATAARVDDVYASTSNNQLAAEPPASYQVFYDELAPYGSWIAYPMYGYVWIPRVSPDFHPYATQGHWVMTNYGWTWVSDFRWGWAAFHYGRWAYESNYGWMWVPGSVWGPAWVDWRESADYYGWAPLGPFMTITVVAACPFDHYRFVPRRHFGHRDVYNYYVDRRQNTTIINHTTVINETQIINKTRYYHGPRKDMVERDMGEKIRTVKVSDNPKPDADIESKTRVKVYRPRMDDKPTDTRKAEPKRVVPTTDLSPIPTDKRLTPSIEHKMPPNTEGGALRPQDKQPRPQEIEQEKPNIKPTQRPRRDEVPQPKPDVQAPPRSERPAPPRRDEVPQPKPDVQAPPKYEREQPRRDEVPPPQPDVQAPPKYERPRLPRRDEAPKPDVQRPRPKVDPRREDASTPKPPKVDQPRREKVTPPVKDNAPAPVKKKDRDDN